MEALPGEMVLGMVCTYMQEETGVEGKGAPGGGNCRGKSQVWYALGHRKGAGQQEPGEGESSAVNTGTLSSYHVSGPPPLCWGTDSAAPAALQRFSPASGGSHGAQHTWHVVSAQQTLAAGQEQR